MIIILVCWDLINIYLNWFERGFTHEYISKCLFEKIPLGINKTSENRFKLIYSNEINRNMDLYIIEIDDYRNIKVITAYNFNKNRRERLKER